MKSEYAYNQLLEQKSIHYLLGTCIKSKFKYRQYDQDNDVDGEIEIFEKEQELLKYITKSKYIKVQLKAQKEIKIKDSYINFNCPVKLIKFIKDCDIPLILVLYDEKTNIGYWLFMQPYISNYIKDNDLNQKNKLIKIPIENSLENQEKFKKEMIRISEDGILEILLKNKKINLRKCYEIIDSEDISIPKKSRKILRIYINSIFLKNQSILHQLLEKISLSEIKNNLNLNIKAKNIDELTIFVYDALNKVGTEGALYRFKTVFKNKKYETELSDLTINSSYQIEESTKSSYLKFIFLKFLKVKNIALNIYACKDIKKNIDLYKDKIEKQYNNFNNFEKKIPYECINLDNKFMEFLTALDNFQFYKDDNYNDYYIQKRINELFELDKELTNLFYNHIKKITL